MCELQRPKEDNRCFPLLLFAFCLKIGSLVELELCLFGCVDSLTINHLSLTSLLGHTEPFLPSKQSYLLSHLLFHSSYLDEFITFGQQDKFREAIEIYSSL